MFRPLQPRGKSEEYRNTSRAIESHRIQQRIEKFLDYENWGTRMLGNT
jgi:hypothetical protein